MTGMTQVDGRRARGATSRRAVMTIAVDLASTSGLDGLSIGELAARANMSKGGVVALFGSKEQLQLATVRAAREIFTHTVIAPALTEKGGIARLRTLVESWLNYSEERVFSGGCFFAATGSELASQPGPVRDAVVGSMIEWHEFLETTIRRAMDRNELDPSTDAAQLGFEITSMLDGANRMSLTHGSAKPYGRARVALARLLG